MRIIAVVIGVAWVVACVPSPGERDGAAVPVWWDEANAAYQAGDYETAYRELLPMAEQGDAVAQYSLGVMYENGQGLPQDYVEAVRWYRLAAEQELYLAQNNLGVMYYEGRGVPQDYTEAFEWYRLAARQGDAMAQYNLGIMYGHGQGVSPDLIRAYALKRISELNGYDPGGIYYDYTWFTPELRAEALALTRLWFENPELIE